MEKVKQLLTEMFRTNEPGISIAIQMAGQPLFTASYGVCDLNALQQISTATCFNIASLTKQFTAFGILLLEAAGKLSLGQQLSDFFPAFNKKVANTVTVSQLLTHSSGMQDHYPYINIKKINHVSDTDVLNAVMPVEALHFEPGTTYRYSNTGYCLLALIIERSSGMPYHQFLQEYIFDRAGMHSSFCWNRPKGDLMIATGYDADGAFGLYTPSGAEQHVFFSTEGDGGIYTCMNDYVKWFKALQHRDIFPAGVVEKSRQPFFAIENHPGLYYAAGWFADKRNAHTKLHHSGSNGGYRSYSFTIPAKDYLIAVFSNRADVQLESLVFTINEWLMPEEAPFTGIDILTS